jgi:hypothetical protein
LKRKRKRSSRPFEWPVPDVSTVGNHQRRIISDSERVAINQTLPPEINREKLWTSLEPLIRETRTPKQIVNDLEARISALEMAETTVTACGDHATAQSLLTHIARLRNDCRYYKDLTQRPRNWQRLKTFGIARAWLIAGGKLTIGTPDDPERMEGERRGTGKPTGPLINYFQTAYFIICGKRLTPEGVKKFLYSNYRQHFHFQYIGAVL